MVKAPKEIGISEIAAKLDDLHGRLSAIETGLGRRPGGPVTDPAPYPGGVIIDPAPYPYPYPFPHPFPWPRPPIPWPWPGPHPGPNPVDPPPFWDLRGQLASIADIIGKLRGPIFDPPPIDFSRMSKEALQSQLHEMNASKVRLDAAIAQIEKQLGQK